MKQGKTMAQPLISVVVPIHKIQHKFSQVRHHLLSATTPIEIFYVIHTPLAIDFPAKRSYEHELRIDNKGRGYMLQEGARHAHGDIILFLHSDTLLPHNWDQCIRHVMDNPKVIGGGFSLQFDLDHVYLKLMLHLITFLVHLTKVLSGDRAIFVRAQPLQNELSILELPLFEDIELSFWMKKHGKVRLLKDHVITSADAFIQHGMICQSWKIFKSLAWYKFKGDTHQIYRYYYSK
jgi:glycosyltransferase involved in cell wall biosynthesis